MLKSSITLVADGCLLYRGHDATELACSASLEDVAALLDEASRVPDLDRYPANRSPGTNMARRGQCCRSLVIRCIRAAIRARLLLDMLADCAPARSPLNEVLALARTVRDTTGAEPTVDYALATIERVLGLPVGAAFTLFAVGRVVGWMRTPWKRRATAG